MESVVQGPPGEGTEGMAPLPSTHRALGRAGGPQASHSRVCFCASGGKLGSEASLASKRVLTTSTYLRLLVVLVLDAVDLLQQVADPVHLESRKASGHLLPPLRAPLHPPGLTPPPRYQAQVLKQAQLGILSSPTPGEGFEEPATCPGH